VAQVEFADDDPSRRRAYIAEQIKMALDQIVPEARPAFLQELGRRFPTGEAAPVAPPPGAAQPAAPAFDERILKDADFLLGSLIDLFPSLDERQKRHVIDELARAKMVKVEKAPPALTPAPPSPPPARQPAAPPASPSALEDELRRVLGIDPATRLDPQRVAALVQKLAGCIYLLDQVVWSTWQEVAPRSSIKRVAEIRQKVILWMTGKAQWSDVEQDLEMLRMLIAGLVAAISKVGSCARHHFEKLSPAAIDGSTEKEFLVPKEVTCWRKYQELYKGFGESLELDMMDVIAKYAASMVKPGQPR